MAFPTGYTKYQNVTIDKDKVDATLTDYPCLIDLSDLDKIIDIFDTCRSDGGDIRVTLSNGTTQLAREVVSIDTSAKTGELYVKIPSLSSSVDTIIRIWYNGTDTEPAEDSTYGKENTWNSDYELVCHMNDLTTSTVKDSTSHGRDGTKAAANQPSEGTGKIGQAQDFDPTIEYISFPAAVIAQAEFAIQFWEYSNGTTNSGYFCSDSDDVLNLFLRRGAVSTNEYNGGIGETSFAAGSGNPPVTRQQWNKSLLNHDSSGNGELILGGVSIATLTGSNFTGLNNTLYLGNRQDLARSFDGLVDEFRVSSVEISLTWEAAECNNQSSPSTFYSVSDEQIAGSTLLPTKLNQSQAIENLDLIQQHVLSISPLNQSQSINSLSLVQSNILIANDINQTQSIENLDLTQANNLSANGINQNQSIENIDLILANSLSINKIDQSQDIDNIDLIQQSDLIISDLSQAQQIDNITLSTSTILSIADLIQSQSIDKVNLIQQNTITIDGIDQGQALEQITLDSGVILAIADIIQNQSIESLNLTQTSIIAIDRLLQGQTIGNVTLSIVGGRIFIELELTSNKIDLGLKSSSIDLEINKEF